MAQKKSEIKNKSSKTSESKEKKSESLTKKTSEKSAKTASSKNSAEQKNATSNEKKSTANKKTSSSAQKKSTEVSVKKSTEVAQKKVKTLGRKKLPALLKKSYSPKKFDKKILSKISIPQDKALIQNLFKTNSDLKNPNNLMIPLDQNFSKSDFKKLKLLAKEIKGQKGRFKLLPLVATVCAIVAFVIVVNIFKNPLAKKIIKTSCETVFSAKTDIESVNISFMSASLTVKNIAIGNKNSEFKNLFEAQKIDLDFDLAKILRGFFDAQNLEVSGIAFNTDRKTSCIIPKKEKQEEKENQESAFMIDLKSKTQKAIEDLKFQMQTMFGESDFNSIAENLESQLQTPSASKNLIETSKSMTEKWKATPAKLESQISDFSKSVENLQSIDVNKISDLNTLKTNLEKINSAITSSSALKKSVESISNDVKTDFSTVNSLAKNLSNAVNADKNFVDEKIGETLDSVKNAKSIFTNALDTVAYDYLGKYYPMAKKAVNYALKLKNNATVQKLASQVAEKSENSKSEKKSAKKSTVKSAKKEGSRRLEGTTLTFGKNYPKFLIEHLSASGEGFSGEINELSSNQDLRGKPMTANLKLNIQNVNHEANFILDARSYSTDALISLDYSGSGISTVFDGTTVASSCGIPSVNANTKLSMAAKFDQDLFSASGNVVLNPLKLSSDGFANEMIDKYYFQALDSVKSLTANYSIGYNSSSGVNFLLGGDFGKTFANALQTAALSIGSDAKDAALAKLYEQINSSSDETKAFVSEFTEIYNSINSKEDLVNQLQAKLESKKLELEAKITESAKSSAKKAATSALKGLLN